MTWKYLIPAFMLVFGAIIGAEAQPLREDLIQFSGIVLDGSDENLIPIPYTNILVKGEGRGTYSDFNGFFSIVVRKGDLVEFSAIGYKSYDLTIPDSLTDNRYSIVQLLTRDTVNLPTAVIFPWPSREHFRLEFLAMDVNSELQAKAAKNLTADNLERLRSSLPYDGRENAGYYMRQQASSYYYIGQTPPMNIFNPIAWKQFFDAWKRGDFKKKN
jgi:hypothetical protein